MYSALATCPQCGKEFTKNRPHRKYCCGQCSGEAATRKARYGTPCAPYNVFERDQFRCVYCGLSSVEDHSVLTVDHIIPKMLGGEHEIGNVVTACSDCNRSKNSYLPDVETLQRLLDEVAKRNEDMVYRRRGEQERRKVAHEVWIAAGGHNARLNKTP